MRDKDDEHALMPTTTLSRTYGFNHEG